MRDLSMSHCTQNPLRLVVDGTVIVYSLKVTGVRSKVATASRRRLGLLQASHEVNAPSRAVECLLLTMATPLSLLSSIVNGTISSTWKLVGVKELRRCSVLAVSA